jgi:hypothetical protein
VLLNQFERKPADHDDQIIAIIQAIKELSGPQPVPKKRRIGFHSKSPQPITEPDRENIAVLREGPCRLEI